VRFPPLSETRCKKSEVGTTEQGGIVSFFPARMVFRFAGMDVMGNYYTPPLTNVKSHQKRQLCGSLSRVFTQ